MTRAALLAALLSPLSTLAPPVHAGTPPACDPGGGAAGYKAALVTPTTRIPLDGSRSSDRDPGTRLGYRWELLTGTGSFDDPGSVTPVLTLATPDTCAPADVMVKLTVSDGEFAVSCFTAVKALERRECAVEMVVLMDTSSSMFDDATELCRNLDTVVNDLRSAGIVVMPEMLGITSVLPSSVFTCLTAHVKARFSDPRVNQSEDWGPATTVVAERHPWRPDHVRLIVPVSDEAPEDGDPCFDPGSDRDAIAGAAIAANAHHVLVSPIAAQGMSAAAIGLGRELATTTRGTHFTSSTPSDLVGAVRLLLETACAAARPVTCAIAPVADIACAGPRTTITLDGSGSGVSCGVGGFLWSSNCPGAVFDDPTSTRPTLTIDSQSRGCDLDCEVSLLVAEGSGTDSCRQGIRVRDDGPPRVAAASFDGSCLWPPDHKYVCFDDLAAAIPASDCSALTVRAVGCRSDQPDDVQEKAPGDRNGDGRTVDDCRLAPDGSSFCVRAERLGGDPAGRHYTLDFEVADACGQATRTSATIHVPHDRREDDSRRCRSGDASTLALNAAD